MYRTIALLLVSAAVSSAATNESVVGLLARIPDPPNIICDEYSEGEKAFRDELRKVTREIKQEAIARNREQKAHAKAQEAEIREKMMRQSGLTQEQIDQVKASGKQGREARAKAKRELAEQMLQQRADLTIAEARALKVPEKKPGEQRSESDITDAKTRAWATQEMAVGRAQAEARTPEEQATEEQKHKRLFDAAKLAKKQKQLLDDTFAGRVAVLDRIHALEAEADEYRRASIEPLLEQLERLRNPSYDADLAEFRRAQDAAEHGGVMLNATGGSGSSSSSGSSGSSTSSTSSGSVGSGGEGGDGSAKLIERKEQAIADAFGEYCGRFSNRYCNLLREYLIWARSAQPELVQYEEMENERMKLMADAPDLTFIATPGGLGLQEAQACIDLLASAFRYSSEYRDRKRATTKADHDGETP